MMDKEKLFTPRLPEADVEIPGVGTIRVRALNRAEVLIVEGVKSLDAKDRKLISLGMVDPALTEAEAGRWQKASPAGELEPVTVKIAELSGMLPDSAKEAVKEFVANPDKEFHPLPGAEAEHDGVAAAGGDG